MKHLNRSSRLLLLLCFIPVLVIAQPSNTANVAQHPSQQKNTLQTSQTSSNNGYTIDGLATASQLAAQRSHAISKDQKLFTFFSGLLIVALVVYLAHTFLEKR